MCGQEGYSTKNALQPHIKAQQRHSMQANFIEISSFWKLHPPMCNISDPLNIGLSSVKNVSIIKQLCRKYRIYRRVTWNMCTYVYACT